MKKSILFLMPFLALTFTSCGSKKVLPAGGDEIELATAVEKFESAVYATTNYDAMGVKLSNGKITMDMEENLPYGNYNYETGKVTYSMVGAVASESITNLNFNLGAQNLNTRGLGNIKASASASANAKLTFDGYGLEEMEEVEKYLGNINESLKGNAYLDEGKLYFDYNDGVTNLVNAILKANGNEGEFETKKYYVDTGMQSMTDFSLMQALALGLSQIDLAKEINNAMPDFVKSFTKGYKYSDTKYAVYAKVDLSTLSDLLSIFANLKKEIFDAKDKGLVEAIIIFDTAKGISEIKLKGDVDADMTIKEYFELSGAGTAFEGLTEEQLNLNYIDLLAKIDLDLKFVYGSSVSVSTLNNKDSYEELKIGGGGNSPQQPMTEVDYNTFMYYVDNRPTLPSYNEVYISGYYLDGNYNFYSTDTGLNDTQNKLVLISDQITVGNFGFVETAETETTHFYYGSDGFMYTEVSDSFEGRVEFDKYGKITHYYYVSEGTLIGDVYFTYYYKY